MKTLFIVGGNGDIGKAITEFFALNSYKVIAPSKKDLCLADPTSIQKNSLITTITPDVFIHCAAVNFPSPFDRIDSEDFEMTLSVNSKSFFYIMQQLAPRMMKKGASVLAISSLYGSISRKNRLAYTASKHALNGMVKTMALELGGNNIKVNSISPGFVDTKLTRRNNNEEKINKLIEHIPLGRLANPMDIAKVAYFLSSPDSYITGQDIIVDGGYVIGGFEGC